MSNKKQRDAQKAVGKATKQARDFFKQVDAFIVAMNAVHTTTENDIQLVESIRTKDAVLLTAINYMLDEVKKDTEKVLVDFQELYKDNPLNRGMLVGKYKDQEIENLHYMTAEILQKIQEIYGR
jgi:GTPase Era involved in 16S rRNA processing